MQFAFAPDADRAVIDISGDGPNNAGMAVAPVRDALVEGGITINGLAIALPRDGTPDTADSFGPGFIEAYYEECVIGGPGAFVIAVDHAAKFADAIREKLVLEIAGRPARLSDAWVLLSADPTRSLRRAGRATISGTSFSRIASANFVA